MSNITNYKILISIPTDAVGLLIGKEGKTFNEISVQSNAKLSLQLHHDICKGSRERSVIIEGDVKSIAKAIKIIIHKLSCRNLSGDAGSEKTELIKWVVSQSRCSMIIGRGGNGIKAIHASSGAWVKIAHIEEACPGEGQRLLYIRGTKSQNEIALNMVRQIAGGHPYDEGLAPKPVDHVKQDLSDGPVPEFLDITVSVKATPHIAKDIPGVDVIIDPEYDVFVKNNFKMRVIGKTKESTILAIDALQNSLIQWENNNKKSASPKSQIDQSILTTNNQEDYIAFKIIVHTDHYMSLCEDIVDTNTSFTIKDLLYRDFNFYLLSLNSSIKFSQTFNARQCVLIGLKDTFLNRLEELIPLISKDIELNSSSYHNIDSARRVVKTNAVPKINNPVGYVNNRSNDFHMQDHNSYSYVPQYVNSYQIPQQTIYQSVDQNNFSYSPVYNDNRSNNGYSYGYTTSPSNQSNHPVVNDKNVDGNTSDQPSAILSQPPQVYNKVYNQTINNNLPKQSPLMNTTYMNQYVVSNNSNDIPSSIYGHPPQLYPYLMNPQTVYLSYPSAIMYPSVADSPPGSARQRGRKKSNSKSYRPGSNISEDLRSRSSSTDSFAQNMDSIYTVLTSIDSSEKISDNKVSSSVDKPNDVDVVSDGISA